MFFLYTDYYIYVCILYKPYDSLVNVGGFIGNRGSKCLDASSPQGLC